jgi:hypothetical protein
VARQLVACLLHSLLAAATLLLEERCLLLAVAVAAVLQTVAALVTSLAKSKAWVQLCSMWERGTAWE